MTKSVFQKYIDLTIRCANVADLINGTYKHVTDPIDSETYLTINKLPSATDPKVVVINYNHSNMHHIKVMTSLNYLNENGLIFKDYQSASDFINQYWETLIKVINNQYEDFNNSFRYHIKTTNIYRSISAKNTDSPIYLAIDSYMSSLSDDGVIGIFQGEDAVTNVGILVSKLNGHSVNNLKRAKDYTLDYLHADRILRVTKSHSFKYKLTIDTVDSLASKGDYNASY